MLDPETVRVFGEGAGGGMSILVAAVFGIPALRAGMRDLRHLVERIEVATDKLSNELSTIEKRVSSLEIVTVATLSIHHGPESLEQISRAAEEIQRSRDAQAAESGHPMRRAEDPKPEPNGKESKGG